MRKYTSLSLSRYLTELCSKQPVPGGGSVSAYVACLGMGLGEMVAQIGLKRVSSDTQAEVKKTLEFLKKARKDALQVVNLDPRVYQSVMQSYAQAKRLSDEERRNRLVDDALENSFRLQADLALLVAMAKKGLESLQRVIRGSIANDLKVGLALLEAAFRGAYETARINAVYLKQPERKARAERALEEVRTKFGEPLSVGQKM